MTQLRTQERAWHPAIDFDECPSCRQPYPGVRHKQEVWLEEAIGDGWRVAVRVGVQDGHPVAAELRVFPDDPGIRLAGEWSVVRLGDDAPVPAGGLSVRKLREVRLHRMMTEALPELVGRFADWLRRSYVGRETLGDELPMLSHAIREAAGKGTPPRKRGASIDPIELAEVARIYVDSTLDPQTTLSPVKATAEKLGPGWTRDRVRDWLSAARQANLLTRVGQGRSGGDLTAKAVELLRLGQRDQ